MARDFDGTDDWIKISNFSNVLSSDKFTIFCWAYADSRSTWGTLFKNWGNTKGQFHLGLDHPSKKLAIHLTQSNGTSKTVTDSSDFPLNSWQAVAAVADGSTLKLYLNGTEIGTSVTYDGTLKTSFACAGIGAKPNDTCTGTDSSTPGYWNGRLAECLYWDTDLSEEDIVAVSNGSLAPSMIQPGNLQFYMPIMGNSSPEPDVSGNGLDGTVTGTSQIAHPPLANPFERIDNIFRIRDGEDATKKLAFEVGNITTGTTRTLIVPNADTTIVGTDVSQPLTNKNIVDPSNRIDIGTFEIISEANGDIIYRNGSSAWTRFPIGTNNQILTVSNGLPAWANTSGGASSLDQLSDVDVTNIQNDHLLKYNTTSAKWENKIASFATTKLDNLDAANAVNANIDMNNKKLIDVDKIDLSAGGASITSSANGMIQNTANGTKHDFHVNNNAVANIDINGVMPSGDNQKDLGASGLEWRDLYIDRTAHIDTARITTLEGPTAGSDVVLAGDLDIISGKQIDFSDTATQPQNATIQLPLNGSNNAGAEGFVKIKVNGAVKKIAYWS